MSDRRIAIGLIFAIFGIVSLTMAVAIDIICQIDLRNLIIFSLGLMMLGLFVMIGPWFLEIPSVLRNIWRVAIGEEEELL